MTVMEVDKCLRIDRLKVLPKTTTNRIHTIMNSYQFTGRGTLAERQQRLSVILHKLNRLAEVHNIAVVVTNQVQSQL